MSPDREAPRPAGTGAGRGVCAIGRRSAIVTQVTDDDERAMEFGAVRAAAWAAALDAGDTGGTFTIFMPADGRVLTRVNCFGEARRFACDFAWARGKVALLIGRGVQA